MAQDTLKLVSINIEMKERVDLVRAFLEEEQPDVACLQEVYEEDLHYLAEKLGMNAAFGQMALMGSENGIEPPLVPFGVAMLSRLPVQDLRRAYYLGNENDVKEYAFKGHPGDFYRLFLHANFQKGDSSFTIGTTHFTWTPDGEADDLQRKDLKNLLAVLKDIPEVVCCGDFNAPRGREIFDTIASYYKDNIPSRYTTSIDVDLHRAGDKLRGAPLMVDGLFTTPAYQCLNIRLQEGVSDHMAIVAEISKI
ncbi:MAG: endonuclease/exonuclease/phosphatase family protein [bacterium]|nr:endonuclease/exonuclease/phosphatase family protein [bacterium]